MQLRQRNGAAQGKGKARAKHRLRAIYSSYASRPTPHSVFTATTSSGSRSSACLLHLLLPELPQCHLFLFLHLTQEEHAPPGRVRMHRLFQNCMVVDPLPRLPTCASPCRCLLRLHRSPLRRRDHIHRRHAQEINRQRRDKPHYAAKHCRMAGRPIFHRWGICHIVIHLCKNQSVVFRWDLCNPVHPPTTLHRHSEVFESACSRASIVWALHRPPAIEAEWNAASSRSSRAVGTSAHTVPVPPAVKSSTSLDANATAKSDPQFDQGCLGHHSCRCHLTLLLRANASLQAGTFQPFVG